MLQTTKDRVFVSVFSVATNYQQNYRIIIIIIIMTIINLTQISLLSSSLLNRLLLLRRFNLKNLTEHKDSEWWILGLRKRWDMFILWKMQYFKSLLLDDLIGEKEMAIEIRIRFRFPINWLEISEVSHLNNA